MSDAPAAAPAAPEASAQPAAVARVSQAKAQASQDPERELRREWKEAAKQRRLRLVAKADAEAQPSPESAAPVLDGQPPADESGNPSDVADSEETAEARTPWAQKVKADLADATTKVQQFEEREAKWTEAARSIKFQHEDISDDLKHAQAYASQLEALLKQAGHAVDPVSKAHFDGQREIAKLRRQIERGQSVTSEQAQTQAVEQHMTTLKQGFGALAQKFPEFRGSLKGKAAGDFVEIELDRFRRTGNIEGLDRRAAAWIASQRGAQPAQARPQPAPAGRRPDSTTLAGQRGGSSSGKGAAPSNKFISDKDIAAEMRALRAGRG